MGELDVSSDVPGEPFIVTERARQAARTILCLKQTPFSVSQGCQLFCSSEASRSGTDDDNSVMYGLH
jgi:hypothetical protein